MRHIEIIREAKSNKFDDLYRLSFLQKFIYLLKKDYENLGIRVDYIAPLNPRVRKEHSLTQPFSPPIICSPKEVVKAKEFDIFCNMSSFAKLRYLLFEEYRNVELPMPLSCRCVGSKLRGK